MGQLSGAYYWCDGITRPSNLPSHSTFKVTKSCEHHSRAIVVRRSSPERFSLCRIDQHLEDQPGHVLAKYLAENKAKNVVLFGNLADSETRLGLYSR